MYNLKIAQQLHDPVVANCRSLAMPGAWCSRFRSSTDMTLQFVGQLHFMTLCVPRYWSLPPDKCKRRGTRSGIVGGSFSMHCSLLNLWTCCLLRFSLWPLFTILASIVFIAFHAAVFAGVCKILQVPARVLLAPHSTTVLISESTLSTHHHLKIIHPNNGWFNTEMSKSTPSS